MTHLKFAGCLLAALCCVGVGYKLAPVRPAETETVFVDKVVYKDRVVTKDVVKTETRPDGTKIVTEEKSSDTSFKSTKELRHETVTPHPASSLPQYSLGVAAVFNPRVPFKREYQIEIGKRLWNSPLSGTLTYQTDKTIAVGLRVDF